MVGEDGVEMDQQFASRCHQGHFGGLAGFLEPLVEGLQFRVMAAGRQRCHVKHPPHAGASAADEALSLPFAAVTVVRREACQGGDLGPRHFAQLGQCRQQLAAGLRADACDGLHDGVHLIEGGIRGDHFIHGGLQSRHLCLDAFEELLALGVHQGELAAHRRRVVAGGRFQGQQVVAPVKQVLETQPLAFARQGRFRAYTPAKKRQQGRVKGIGLGLQVESLAKWRTRRPWTRLMVS